MSDDTLSTIFNYVPVDENLASAGQPKENELSLIADAGFEVVINLALHDDPRYSLPDEAGSVRSLGMIYEHIPVIFNRPEEKDLLAFFTAMEKHAGRKIFVHCAANKRVSAFLGLYFAIRKKQDDEQAFALMRDVWEPDEIWSAFIFAMRRKYKRA
ncbi:MAG TPA: protein tyrosine phosphatase family protein [Nitrospirota bacterium]|nr:protein tyrosine phosphatase family protein [Nitrospirota bacterium]